VVWHMNPARFRPAFQCILRARMEVGDGCTRSFC
jgi:hypothetical protein